MFTGIPLFFSRKNLRCSSRLSAGLPTLALARPPARRRKTPQYEALPLERSSQNHLLVRAEINGKPAVLLVDTGAPLSAVALDRAAHFGMIPVSAKSKIPSRLNINGAFNSMSIARSLRLGALNLVDEADGADRFLLSPANPDNGGNRNAKATAFSAPTSCPHSWPCSTTIECCSF